MERISNVLTPLLLASLLSGASTLASGWIARKLHKGEELRNENIQVR
jgi:hypothetical protein